MWLVSGCHTKTVQIYNMSHINQILRFIYLVPAQWTLVHSLAFQPELAFLLEDKRKERKTQIRAVEKKLGQWLS